MNTHRRITWLLSLFLLSLLMAACSPAAPAAEPDAAELPAEEAIAEEPAAEEPAGLAFAPAAAVEAVSGEAQRNAAPQGMSFEDYGDNPYILAGDDPLSTFSIDVDTGSYTLTRSYLEEGNLPPQEAIRVEEFVNYFDQGYALPGEQQTFAIDLTAAPTPFNLDGHYVMRVGIQGFDVAAQDRPDANLVFVIDVSGSMAGPERLGAVQRALLDLTGALRPTDQVAIVVYGSQGRLVQDMIPVGSRTELNASIVSLQSDGSTNAEEGLRIGYEVATAHFDRDRINRIILCSDGVANVGVTGPEPMLEVVRQQAREGIQLTTVGFGMGNYNDVLMEQLANDGDGQYFYVDGPDEASRLFVDELTGTLLTIASDVKIQVEFNPETVEVYRLIGYENRAIADEDFRDDTVDAGEVGAGHSVTALYEILPRAGAQGPVATVTLRWQNPASGQPSEIEQALDASQVLPAFDAAPASFRLSAIVAAFADQLSGGQWAGRSSFAELEELVFSLQQDAPNADQAAELLDLIRRAGSLSN